MSRTRLLQRCLALSLPTLLVLGGTAYASTLIPLAPYAQCPEVGLSASCQVLLVIEPSGSITVYSDSSVPDFDGADDTLVGILNNFGSSVDAVTVTGPGSDLGGFDGDGLCSPSFGVAGCPYGPTGYEGPGTSFVTSADPDSAEIDFTGGLAYGASAYFSLEGSLSDAVLTARRGHLDGITYAALGDSYSSGEGLEPYEGGSDTDTDKCHRSDRAYPELLANDGTLGVHSLDFVACSGATRHDLWLGRSGEGSQFGAITPQTNLVSVSIGGNDAEFTTMLKKCILSPKTPGASADCKRLPAKDPVTNANTTLDGRAKTLVSQLGVDSATWCETPNGYVVCSPSLHWLYEYAASLAAPGARLRVLLYPHLFTTSPGKRGCTIRGAAGLNFTGFTATISQANILWINAGVDKVDAKIIAEVALARAAGADIEYVDPRAAFDDASTYGASPGGHGVCTALPWLNGAIFDPKSGSFHPNATGQYMFGVSMFQSLN